MSTILPINLDDLLHCRSVESERVEFKRSWDPKTTGPQVLKTICAFANDYHNLNGGYIIIGVEERDGRAVLPPSGLNSADIEAAQKWIQGNCNRLDPAYAPILSPEVVGNRSILVVWVPASDHKPHRAPDGENNSPRFWIRIGSETVNAEQKGGLLQGLLEQTAKVPWDDRRMVDARIEDLREAKIREHLRDIRSGLLDETNAEEVCRRMQITTRVNDHEVPRNVGLLFFSEDPTQWFRGARIEVVQFAAGGAGDVIEERTFSGGLADQLRNCLEYLENMSATHLQKEQDRHQVRGWVSYPLQAIRETLVNAVYHRSYQPDQPEPTKVYLHPDRIEVTSYPGPVPGIQLEHLTSSARVPPAPARNRRIGEFLKELRLAEGRLTGLPKVFNAMKANGSPTPCFDFDEKRTYFRATLPAHPEYSAISALRDAAHLRVLGQNEEANQRIESAWKSNRASAVLAVEMIRLYAQRDAPERAEDVWKTFREQGSESALAHVTNTLVEALFEAREVHMALQILQDRGVMFFGQDAVDAAIQARRLRNFSLAHRYFERAGDTIQSDPRALLEFAQTKMRLAGKEYKDQSHNRSARESNRRFLTEARTFLERVIQLDASPTRHAWAWRELARTLNWLKAPVRDVEDAYVKAIELLPSESIFTRELDKFRKSRNN